MWLMKLLRKLYWWFYIVFLSLRWINKFNLGDRVIHDGKEWKLVQGVCAPSWDLVRIDEAGNTIRKDLVPEKDFTKVRSLKNYWGSYTFGYSFYMGYWYNIWVNAGILPWMRACRIWAKKEKVDEVS